MELAASRWWAARGELKWEECVRLSTRPPWPDAGTRTLFVILFLLRALSLCVSFLVPWEQRDGDVRKSCEPAESVAVAC